jgi:pimeloyl-ACP methyl ester carboxylesterase
MRTIRTAATVIAVLTLAAVSAGAAPLPPAALYADPAPDATHPARSEVLHIPSGGVLINGLAYIPAGAGPHPAVVLLHGLPGNEKNLDLAQAMRRAGWTVVTFNYRGSWGSPGAYSFSGNLEDARAVLAFVRGPENAARLQLDPKRLVIMGHSMGGWVTAVTAGKDDGLIGAALISAADMSGLRLAPSATRLQVAAGNMESLAGVTAQSLADQFLTLGPDDSFAAAAPGLAARSLLVLSGDDGLAAGTDALVADVRKRGGTAVTAVHVATDHTWDDARVRLETEVLTWLQGLPGAPKPERPH